VVGAAVLVVTRAVGAPVVAGVFPARDDEPHPAAISAARAITTGTARVDFGRLELVRMARFWITRDPPGRATAP